MNLIIIPAWDVVPDAKQEGSTGSAKALNA